MASHALRSKLAASSPLLLNVEDDDAAHPSIGMLDMIRIMILARSDPPQLFESAQIAIVLRSGAYTNVPRKRRFEVIAEPRKWRLRRQT